MSERRAILEIIEQMIVEHGGDLGGWTQLEDDRLKLFDGRITLHIEFPDGEVKSDAAAIHAHVYATLHEHDDEMLDACLVGMGETREQALGQIGVLWVTGVAGPIRSFLDNKPVCMTCQAGVIDGDAKQGYVAGDYGLPGLRAYVGPSFSRGEIGPDVLSRFDDHKPWFRYAAESAAPRRIHLAKATVLGVRDRGWSRDLEIDGHDVLHHEDNWEKEIAAPKFGYMTRFAVFEFPLNSSVIPKRAELERTIRRFAALYSQFESVDQLLAELEKEGFTPENIHGTEAFATIAFARTLFEPMGAAFSPAVIRARADGRIESDVPLMSIPAYNRGRAIAAQLRREMPEDQFNSICFYNAEAQTLLQVLEKHGAEVDFSAIKMYPCIVPDPGVSDETMAEAMEHLQALVDASGQQKKKPWWKFW
ncbi:MAG: hypothetical protein U0892_10645 [Pirellulales bacterium]